MGNGFQARPNHGPGREREHMKNGRKRKRKWCPCGLGKVGDCVGLLSPEARLKEIRRLIQMLACLSEPLEPSDACTDPRRTRNQDQPG